MEPDPFDYNLFWLFVDVGVAAGIMETEARYTSFRDGELTLYKLGGQLWCLQVWGYHCSLKTVISRKSLG